MDTKSAMLAGAAATVIAASAFIASPAAAEPIPPAASYADLLQPVPNAMERLQADDARQGEARMIQAQYGNGPYAHHHHHHHHHHYRSRRWYLNNGYVWSGGAWIVRPVAHHHHHHHHHHMNY